MSKMKNNVPHKLLGMMPDGRPVSLCQGYRCCYVQIGRPADDTDARRIVVPERFATEVDYETALWIAGLPEQIGRDVHGRFIWKALNELSLFCRSSVGAAHFGSIAAAKALSLEGCQELILAQRRLNRKPSQSPKPAGPKRPENRRSLDG